MPLVDEKLQAVWRPTPAQYSLLRLCRLRWKGRCRVADLKKRISGLAEMVIPGIDRVMPMRYSKSARLFLRRYLAPEKARRLGKKRLGQILAKAAWGLADDLLSTVLLAFSGPVLMAPAMNDRMWEKPSVQRNVARLRQDGVHLVDPEEGYLSCGARGPGRMASPETVFDTINTLLDSTG